MSKRVFYRSILRDRWERVSASDVLFLTSRMCDWFDDTKKLKEWLDSEFQVEDK